MRTPPGADPFEQVIAAARAVLRRAAEPRPGDRVASFDPRAGFAASALATAARNGLLGSRADVDRLLDDGIDVRDVAALLAYRLVTAMTLVPGVDVGAWLAAGAMHIARNVEVTTPKGD